MGIRITLRKTVCLDDTWCSKEDFDEVFRGNKPALVELLNEDIISFLEDCGGIDGLIESFEWVKSTAPGVTA